MPVFLWLAFDKSFASGSNDVILTSAEQRWLDAHPSIKLAYDGFFPPNSFINDSGVLEGYAVDVFHLIEAKLGVRFDIVPEKNWAKLYQAGINREVDIIATMVDRPERTPHFLFTRVYIDKPTIIITRTDSQEIYSPEDLSNKKVAVVKGYQYIPGLLRQYPSITPVYVDTILDALTAVSLGDVDATLSNLGAAHFYRTKYLLTNIQFVAVYEKDSAPDRIAVRKDWPELQSILNKALNSIPESRLQSLREKWLPSGYRELLYEINLTKQERQWIKEHKTIRVGVDPEFAPFEFIENGHYHGMASDYLRLLNQRLHLKMEVVQGVSWEDVMVKVKNGEIDVLPAVGYTKERSAFLNYTDAYMAFYRVIITRDNAPIIYSLRDISGMRVAVQKNSSHHGYLLENSELEPIGYSGLQSALLAVSGGEADAFVGNVASSTYWIRKLHLTNLKVAAPASADVQSLHFAVRKDWPLLTDILQKGLDSISVQQRDKISKKWLSIEYDKVFDFKLMWQTIAGFSAILAVVMLWNILLNRKVRIRTSQLAYSANYDQLTGLPNRVLILDRIAQAIHEARQSAQSVALLSVDLDGFRKINDTLGHEAGDALLKEVVVRINALLRPSDTLGRLGGDQFLVIVHSLGETTDAAVVATSLLKSFETVFEINGKVIALTASIGIAIFPDDGRSHDVLFKHADSAMHYAKENGCGSYAFFTRAMNENVARRLSLETQMRCALQRGDFHLVYQPKIHGKTRRVVGFEALLRWRDSVHGLVTPDEFIPLAEKNGLIVPIGNFVLDKALETLFVLQRLDKKMTMAINLSPVQFKNDAIIDQVLAAIDRYDISPDTVEFEITEGVLMSGVPLVDKTLKELSAYGIKLSMDDYGTGYSSLSYLHKYKFDLLKIDREFIADLDYSSETRKLVAATIAMAHGLNMTVVAEGVETKKQSELLVKFGCDVLQGWLYGKPMTAIQAEGLLKEVKMSVMK